MPIGTTHAPQLVDIGENGAIAMEVHQSTKRWHRTRKSLKAAWAKLLAKLYPGLVQPKSPEVDPTPMATVVDAQSTAGT
jgi:hypothetical protein